MDRTTSPVAGSEAPAAASARLYYLDWIRVAVIAGVYVTHAMIVFSGLPWLINSSQTLFLVVTPLLAVANQIGMPLLFMVSGAATWFSLRKRTSKQFIGERFSRLVIPYLVFVMLLSADGWRVTKIAELLRVDQATVHRWLDRCEAGGLAGLASQWSDGRPPAWDASYEWLLVETVRHDPRWYGLAQSLWTCSLLAGYLAERTGTSLSAERVRVRVQQHGIHLKQPTPVVHSRDPQYDPKG